MRHSSERVPGKNYRDFNGKPLFHWILEALLDSGCINEVLIDTDSELIINDAAQFENVRTIRRPPNLLGGQVPMNEILLHDVTQADADWYLQTHSTNPLLRPETIRRAVDELLEASGDQYDSLFSVTALHKRLYAADGTAINHDPAILLRTQDLPPVFEENSCIYLFQRSTLERYGNRIGKRPMMFEMDADEATDIDVELDFQVAEALCKLREADK